MMTSAQTLYVPLTTDAEGVMRVGHTRVRLDTVVYAFNEGYTAEDIVNQYPALNLSDVYAVIAYYLNSRALIDEYIVERSEKAREIRQEIESKPEYRAFREQTLKRRETLQTGKS